MMEKKTPIQLSINPKSETENDIDHREHTSNKPADLQVHKYNFVSEYWRFINELDKLWFSYLALNPFIVWLFALMYDD
jgi:hypothetical protein